MLKGQISLSPNSLSIGHYLQPKIQIFWFWSISVLKYPTDEAAYETMFASFLSERKIQPWRGIFSFIMLVPVTAKPLVSHHSSVFLNIHQSQFHEFSLLAVTHMFSFTALWVFSRQPVCWKEINPSGELRYWILSSLWIHVFTLRLFISGLN